ncbi:SGT1 protein-domain-containing protein [Dichomitus squalens]|uniref:SGT1 protein-domain-containing protein n=1 Tax=Dichomitus squalens TaxID=114155 RepID=A0A4Q9N7T2_9APHY|nr:SGT1 protein-domain-containing protein [Dichomitus squalens]
MVSVNDIFNRPPTISEDALQYTLYLPPDQSDRVSATALAALLSEQVQSLLPEHLWHRDTFELKVAQDSEGQKDVWVLEGRMRVGDCIDDEWCTVWLLRELSSKWDIVISVYDSDGEFLLIEAAEELPSWVTPTNAENRVWIHSFRLHLVPLSHVSPPSSKTRRKYVPYGDDDNENQIDESEENHDFITAADAVKLVRDPLVDTLAPQNVQDVVWKRISGYPAASRQHVHVTKAYLPVDVARALAVNPALVQKAVETFYTRDALQLRAAQKMSRFPPEPATLSTVKMTRTAYAQLLGQKFHPPKVFGRWEEREGTKEWRWRDVGMKIACGFEMLYQESKNRRETTSVNFDGSPASLEALKDSLRRNPEYTRYIRHLVSVGYFKGELEGSQLWTTLENKAAASFVAARKDDDASRPSFATAIQAAVSQYTDDRALPQQEEDLDDWLNVDAADFDAMLEKTMHGDKGKGEERASNAMDIDTQEDEEDRIAKMQATRLRDLAQKVEHFVEGQGDVEGARFADETFSEDEDSDNGDDDPEEEDLDMDEDAPPPTRFTSGLSSEKLAERKAAMDKLVPGIEPSEYGKMPSSYYTNSQRVAPVTMETEIRENIPSGTPADTNSRVRSHAIRAPLLPRDNFDGVDSDDESEEEDPAADEEDEEHPQVVGDVEIDMGEEEEEFIEFARQALGVDDEQWRNILQDRRDRGAFVPTHVVSESGTQHPPAPKVPVRAHTTSDSPTRGKTLASFDEVMKAMDAELERARRSHSKGQGHHTSDSKGKGKDSSMDIEAAMEAELQELLAREQTETEEHEDDTRGGTDYHLIKNFLESFKSQAGLSGPVSNLVGRLEQGWTLPRDEH